jgi:hypothetical protein
MDDMLILGGEYVCFIAFIGLTTCIYLSCFLQFERKELRKFITDEIEKKMNKTM